LLRLACGERGDYGSCCEDCAGDDNEWLTHPRIIRRRPMRDSILREGRELLLVRIAESRQRPCVHRFPLIRNDLEVQRVLRDPDQHEVIARIEAFCRELAALDVTVAKLRRAAGDEVVNPLLRLDALVEMLVPAEYGVDAVSGY
jgi:hypothetical protein